MKRIHDREIFEKLQKGEITEALILSAERYAVGFPRQELDHIDFNGDEIIVVHRGVSIGSVYFDNTFIVVK